MPTTHTIDPDKPTVTTPQGRTLETIVDMAIPDGHQRREVGRSAADNNPRLDPKPTPSKGSADALDALFKAKGGDPNDPAANQPPEDPKTAKAKQEPEEVVEPAKPAEKTEPAKPEPTKEPAKPEAKTEPAKPEAKTEPAKTEPVAETDAVKKLNESLETVQLGPNAKPKTGEAFGRVKELAREAVSTLEKQLLETQKQLEEAKKAAESAPKPEALAELEDLRKWRNAVEVDKDPQWAEYDTKIQANSEKVFSKLKEEGMTDDQLKKIRELGLGKVKWAPLFEHMTLGAQKFIERMLDTNETLAIEKVEKLEEAKKNADAFVKEREEKAKQASAGTIESRKKAIEAEIEKADFLKLPPLDPKATDEQKKAYEAGQKRVQEIRNLANVALSDDSPDTWAALVYGTMLAHYYSDQLHALDARAKALETEKNTLQEKLDKIKGASKGAGTLRPDPSLSKPAVPKIEKTQPFQFKSGRDALDALMAQKVAEREA